MKTTKASLSVSSILVIAVPLFVGILKIQQVNAQVDATSSDAVATPSDSPPPSDTTTGTTTDTESVSPSTEVASSDAETAAPSDVASAPEASSVTPSEPAPVGLTEVHIIGTKYIDYFTDGTTVTAYPGDPAIDSNFDKPDAPIPTHEGLTWMHSTGGYLYDTPSGDLEVGQYALDSNGSYISKAPPFISSTSTPAVLGEATSAAAATATNNASTSDTVAPTTTPEDSTTTPVTNDGASDASEPPPTATTTDTPSI
jgi:hypothetical protein